MRPLSVLFFSALFAALSSFSQTAVTPTPETPAKKEPLFGISFSGYVKTDLFFDSRQTVSLREGHFLLFPENVKKDDEGFDINDKASYNILSIQTRLAGSISGPDILGARSSAYFEGEFFGNINTGINSFRLRHAWIKLKWPKTELLTGQWWHPMFVPECSPQTVSFNTGAPFVVFSRNPQIRVTQTFGKFSAALTILSQVDFVSDGPDGPSPKYLRNSVIPESNLTVQYTLKNEERGREFMAGAGINCQVLTPRLFSSIVRKSDGDSVSGTHSPTDPMAVYRTRVTTAGLAAVVYLKMKMKKFTVKAGGEYGDNNYAYTMIGGYAVHSVTDAARGFVDYANLRSFAAWAEVHTNGTRWQPGLFGAYGKNLGYGQEVVGPFYARGANIGYAWRISPRLVYNIRQLRIAGEVEYTVAAYGSTATNGSVKETKEVGNARVLIGVYYFF